jgi:hypothetical protein
MDPENRYNPEARFPTLRSIPFTPISMNLEEGTHYLSHAIDPLELEGSEEQDTYPHLPPAPPSSPTFPTDVTLPPPKTLLESAIGGHVTDHEMEGQDPSSE